MASEVDIANLALARLGDVASVASISPPEGSAQAEHCAKFYPIARDSMFELHDWKFICRRATLAVLDTDSFNWAYAYALPSNFIRILAVLPATGSVDDHGVDYEIENKADGTGMILTNLAEATVHYSVRVTDTTKFSPLFVDALGWLLASHLAGPVIKGDAGTAEAKRCMTMFQAIFQQAIFSDANQHQHKPDHTPDWIDQRGVVNPYLFDGRITR
jgi:hypothetical protein